MPEIKQEVKDNDNRTYEINITNGTMKELHVVDKHGYIFELASARTEFEYDNVSVLCRCMTDGCVENYYEICMCNATLVKIKVRIGCRYFVDDNAIILLDWLTQNNIVNQVLAKNYPTEFVNYKELKAWKEKQEQDKTSVGSMNETKL